jgi:hypothetical protein
LKVSPEPLIQRGNLLRADFSTTSFAGGVTFYDVTVHNVSSSSATKEASSTLSAAASQKRLRYRNLGEAFSPLVFSTGGLMEKTSAQAYKRLQKAVGESTARWMDCRIALTLARRRLVD